MSDSNHSGSNPFTNIPKTSGAIRGRRVSIAYSYPNTEKPSNTPSSKQKDDKSENHLHPPGNTASPVDHDLVSEVSFHSQPRHHKTSSHVKHRTNQKTAQIIAITRWLSLASKQQRVLTLNSIAKAFYKWRYSVVNNTKLPIPPYSHSSVDEPLVDSESWNDDSSSNSYRQHQVEIYQKKYLTLFAESEKLREQLHDYKKAVHFKNEVLKKKGSALLVKIFLRHHINDKLRKSFDVWLHNTQAMNAAAAIKRKELQLEVGLKQVEAGLSVRTHLQEDCKLLRRELAISMAFYHWKINKGQTLLSEERAMNSQYRRELLAAVKMMKNYVQRSGQSDQLAATAVVEREEAVHELINSLSNMLKNKSRQQSK